MVTYLGYRSASSKVSKDNYLFVDSMHEPIKSDKVNKFIKSVVKSMGLHEKYYSAHSIRAGVATTAARAGFSEMK